MSDGNPDYDPRLDQVQREIDEAVQYEREVCAQIADEEAQSFLPLIPLNEDFVAQTAATAARDAALDIAQRIRARGQQ